MNLTREHCGKCGGSTLHRTLICCHCGAEFKPPPAANIRVGMTGEQLRKTFGSLGHMRRTKK